MPTLINVKFSRDQSRCSVLASGPVKYSDTRRKTEGNLQEKLTPNKAIAIMKPL
jgi:hypothetical protein